MTDSYDKIDRFLRNNLDDTDYAEYSDALDEVLALQPSASAEPVQPLSKYWKITRIDQDRHIQGSAMTDHTPSGLPQPQTAEFEDWAVSQMYAVRTDSGRLKWNSPAYEAIAKAALSAPAVETVAVQEAVYADCFIAGYAWTLANPEGSLAEMTEAAWHWAKTKPAAPAVEPAPLPVAPKAEPTDTDPSAPWLTKAHLLCTDHGIPQGRIDDRLDGLRERLSQPVADRSAEAIEQLERLDVENHSLREQVKALTREAWTWNQALTEVTKQQHKARELIAKWRHAAEHFGLDGLASLADCADELEAALGTPQQAEPESDRG